MTDFVMSKDTFLSQDGIGALETVKIRLFLVNFRWFVGVSSEESVVVLRNEVSKARGEQWIILERGLYL